MSYRRTSPIPVIEGGSGNQSFTEYGLICGGNSETAPLQQIGSMGDEGMILTSNGDSSLPEFKENIPFPTNEVNATSDTMIVNNIYITNNGSPVVLTLPAVSAVGSIIIVVGKGSGGWKVAQNAGNIIRDGILSTTVGTLGSVSSAVQYATMEIICIVANTTWVVRNSSGTLTII